MSSKKDNLPINIDADLENGGTITYANEVIAIIAGVAANEIDGIAGMCTSGGFGDILGRNRNITRGVKVEIGSEEASVDLYAIVEYGKPIQRVASEAQENVRKAIESMTSLHVVRVDVHVQGVSFEKEKKAVQKGIESANMPSLTEPSADAKTVEVPDMMPVEVMDEAISQTAVALDETPEKQPEEVVSNINDDGPEVSNDNADEGNQQTPETPDSNPENLATDQSTGTTTSNDNQSASIPVTKATKKRIRRKA